MNQEQFISWLKTTLGFIAGFVVAKGYISESAATAISGAVIAIAPLVWGYVSNTKFAQIKQASTLPEVARVVLKSDVGNDLAAAAADPAQPKITK
jgi:hypothetical protein